MKQSTTMPTSTPRAGALAKTFICFVTPALLVLSGLALPVGSTAATLPTLPQVFDTTYTAPVGATISVASGGNLQNALNQAKLGDTIVLAAGASFTGPFTLPNKGSGSGWIYVRTSAYTSLPAPGTRVSQSDAKNMPKIVAPDSAPAVVTVNGSHHFRFVGIEFTNAPSMFTYNLVELGNGDTSTATLPNNLTFDRCLFLADATATGVRRGLLANAAYVAVIDSDLEGFREIGGDSQAIMAFNTSGPIKIVNNYIVGAAENVLFGGGDSANATLVPADVEIRGNHLFKPLSWVGSQWVVKNLLELKAVKRALITGNVLENNWAAGQTGFSLLVTPRNQDGTAPWSVTEDVTITSNRMINIGSGINILGSDNIHASQQTVRILVKNNVLTATGLNGAQGVLYQILGGPTDVTIDHNTAFGINSFLFADGSASQKALNFVFTNNIVTKGTYGLIGTGTGDGLGTLNTFFGNWNFTHNAVIGGTLTAYPTGNFSPSDVAAVKFADFAGGDFHLAAASPFKGAATDGTDLGADIATLASASNSTQPVAATPAPAAPRPLPPINVTVR